MGRGIQQKSLKRTKRERVKNRLAKLEAVQKAKDDGTYIPKPWENRPLIQELYSFAIKSHKTQKAADAEHQNGDGQSTAGSDGDSIMDLGKNFVSGGGRVGGGGWFRTKFETVIVVVCKFDGSID